MAVNITGIPFSTEDEGVDYPLQAKQFVIKETVRYNIDTNTDEYLGLDEVYIVWFSYILGGWKALLSTVHPDGKYYEVTYNRVKHEVYVDTYVKTSNTLYRNPVTDG